jgi:hypothetical protein
MMALGPVGAETAGIQCAKLFKGQFTPPRADYWVRVMLCRMFALLRMTQLDGAVGYIACES